MPTFKTSKSREKILGRIRNGLSKAKLPVPYPEAEKQRVSELFHYENPAVEEMFADEFIKLGGRFVYCDNEQELLENIHALRHNRGWKEVLCAEPELMQIFQNNRLDFIKPAKPEIKMADACITNCEALVARTGSCIVSSRQQFGRTTPVFYPVHIIVAYSSQVVKDIQEGTDLIKRKYGGKLPSMINLNTGPSRTADIEKTLVVGIHGPGEVFCFFVNV